MYRELEKTKGQEPGKEMRQNPEQENLLEVKGGFRKEAEDGTRREPEKTFLQKLEEEIRQELDRTEAYLADYLRDPGFGGSVEMILQDLAVSKGKRLRPRLLLMAGRCGKDFTAVRDRLSRLGALVELVHMASLIHDDIVDDAPLRRGRMTTQAKYGKDRAVYAGDLLLSRIVQSLFRDGFHRVGVCFGDAVEAMCLGEIGQMECRFREDVTVEQYMRNIYGKTAALCRLACTAGAVESGCEKIVQRHLEELGVHFGYMFQIRDDLLDFTSDTAREGKKTQTDFREGILTLPVIYAMENPAYRPELCALLRKAREGSFDREESARLVEAVTASGGIDRAAADMKMYAQKALESIDILPDSGVRSLFGGLICGLLRTKADRPS
ncbi:MAG: polyprenyl synthetase family protein [Eubacteriales bacterium]|nr:polyprenyl synthetase family protein [Eubacteriales bacterium]